MSKSLYSIEQDILEVEELLIENGGELTPEIEEKMNFNKENLANKIKGYTEVITLIESQILVAKQEEARIKSYYKAKENAIKSLKDKMAIAIESFGDTSRNGSKFVDYGTGIASIRHSKSVEVNEELIKRFTKRFMTAAKQGFGKESCVDYANQQSEEEKENGIEIPKITLDDIDAINIIFTVKTTLGDINSESGDCINYLSNSFISQTDSKVDKTAMKGKKSVFTHEVEHLNVNFK